VSAAGTLGGWTRCADDLPDSDLTVMIERFEELMETARLLEVPASSGWLAEVPAFALQLWAMAPEREDAEMALRQVVWRWLGGVNGAPVSWDRASRGFAALLEAIEAIETGKVGQ
jgi:hypothetical protein